MDDALFIINKLMADIFYDILKIEEIAIKNSSFDDVSVSEIHTIEAIGLFDRKTMGEIAKRLGITVGTLTVAINHLVKKGYVQRFRTQDDRRVVKVGLTKKGRVLFRLHDNFHKKAAKESMCGLNDIEIRALASALSKVHAFLLKNYLGANI